MTGKGNRLDGAIVMSLAAIAVAAAVGFELAPAHDGSRAAFRSVPLDDSWIHYVYAESLGTSLRLDYNPGHSEAGFTSLLWVALLALPLALGADAPLASKVLGLLAHAAVATVLFLWLRRHVPRVAAAGAALLVAIEPIFGYAAMSGMEVMLYTALVTAGIALFLSGRYRGCAAALALAVLARPDGMVLVGVTWIAAVAHMALGRPTEPRPRPVHLAWLVGLPAAAAGLWLVVCLASTGMPFPTSYYVRADGVGLLSNLQYVGRILHEISYSLFPLSHWPKALLLLPGVVAAGVHYRARAVLPILFPLAFALSMGGEVIGVIGGSFMGNRYLVPVFPPLLALQVLGIGWLVERGRNLFPGLGRRAGAMAALILLATLALPPGQWIHRWRESRTTYAQGCQNIDDMQVALGRWVAEHTAADAVIAVHDAGAIRYIGGRYTIDVLGLNTTDLPAEDVAVVRAMADYLITFPSWTPNLVEPFADHEILRVVLENNEVCADDTMVVYDVRRARDP